MKFDRLNPFNFFPAVDLDIWDSWLENNAATNQRNTSRISMIQEGNSHLGKQNKCLEHVWNIHLISERNQFHSIPLSNESCLDIFYISYKCNRWGCKPLSLSGTWVTIQPQGQLRQVIAANRKAILRSDNQLFKSLKNRKPEYPPGN